MKTLALFLSAAAAGAAMAARVEQVTLDLERPKRQFALTFAEAASTTVRAQLRASGAEFDPEGWAGLLWYGTEAGGITITNSTASYGSMEWAVPASAVPTNGRYSVQILGVSGSTVEEWGTGALSVRLSPSAGSLPADWLAGNVAYIVATNALSRVTVLEGALDAGTNNWNDAYGWGNHAGLYRDIGWVPSWTEVTGKPDLFDWNYESLTNKPPFFDWDWNSLTNKPSIFPPSAHTHPYTDITDPPWLTSFTEQDITALQALSDYADTNRVVRWWNSDGDMFVTLEDGKGSVWEVTSQTNIGYIVSDGENLEPFAVGQVFLFQSNVTNSSPPAMIHQITYTNENPNLQLVWIRINPTGMGWLNGDWRLCSVFNTLYSKVGNWPMTFELPLRSATENPIYFADYSEVLLFTNLVYTFAASQQVETVSSNLGIHTNNEAIHLSIEQTERIANAVTNETDETALAALAAHAAYWPPDATASSWFTYTTNAGAITITGYNIAGGTDVVIPEYINGWPVTAIGAWAFSDSSTESGDPVASVIAPKTVITIGVNAFFGCPLTTVSLPQATSIGADAFFGCPLTTVSLQATSIGDAAFVGCPLTTVSLPPATSIGDAAFSSCSSLTAMYFGLANAPTIGTDIFANITANQVTNYVTNPTATGWGDKLGGMPVVRLPLYADEIYQAGERVATTGHVAQAIAAIPEPDLSGKVDVQDGVATNLNTFGWLALPQTQATNLTYRLVTSNDVILAIGVWE